MVVDDDNDGGWEKRYHAVPGLSFQAHPRTLRLQEDQKEEPESRCHQEPRVNGPEGYLHHKILMHAVSPQVLCLRPKPHPNRV